MNWGSHIKINNYYTFYFDGGATATGTVLSIEDNLIIMSNSLGKKLFLTKIESIMLIEELDKPIIQKEAFNKVEEIEKKSSDIIKNLPDEKSKKTLKELQQEKRKIEKQIIQDKITDHTFSGTVKETKYGIPYIRKKPKFE